MANLKILRLKAKPGSTLNSIVEYIRKEKRSLPARVAEVELLEGAAPLFGAGDAPTVEITIKYTVDDPSVLEDIEQLIEVAAERSDEIEIIIDDE